MSIRRAAGCAMAAAVLAAGCGGPDSGGTPSGKRTPHTGDHGGRSPAPEPADPAEVCAQLISYWVREALKDSSWAGLDWEQKGLSNEQLAIHDEVLAAARAERRRHGAAAADDLIRRQSRRRCAEEKGATGSSENWRPPD